MSAREFRQRLEAKIDEYLHGENGGGGIVATVSGRNRNAIPKDYAVYRDLCGQVYFGDVVLGYMDQVWAEMHDVPNTITEPKTVDRQGAI